MDGVGHQPVRMDRTAYPLRGQDKRLQKLLLTPGGGEYGLPVIAALNDVNGMPETTLLGESTHGATSVIEHHANRTRPWRRAAHRFKDSDPLIPPRIDRPNALVNARAPRRRRQKRAKKR